MTRVRLPPDPENSCITTIVDSQGGDAALMSAVATLSIPGSSGSGGTGNGGESSTPTATPAAMLSLQKSLSGATAGGYVGGIENVDSIILVYDLDRDETFFRLENHWLPLIERCYSGGVSRPVDACLTNSINQSAFGSLCVASWSCSISSRSLLLETRWTFSFHPVRPESLMSRSLPAQDNK